MPTRTSISSYSNVLRVNDDGSINSNSKITDGTNTVGIKENANTGENELLVKSQKFR